MNWKQFNYARQKLLLIEANWRAIEGSILRTCIKHKTVFDPYEEPCWQCWNPIEEATKDAS